MNHVFIIAEMSANHCGDFELAKKIIAAAKAAIIRSSSMLRNAESPDPVAVPCVISRLLPDGTSEPAWLQDMSPYLDRAEFATLMQPSQSV